MNTSRKNKNIQFSEDIFIWRLHNYSHERTCEKLVMIRHCNTHTFLVTAIPHLVIQHIKARFSWTPCKLLKINMEVLSQSPSLISLITYISYDRWITYGRFINCNRRCYLAVCGWTTRQGNTETNRRDLSWANVQICKFLMVIYWIVRQWNVDVGLKKWIWIALWEITFLCIKGIKFPVLVRLHLPSFSSGSYLLNVCQR